MKTGYTIESTTFESSRFIYQFNFQSLNVIGDYGFDNEKPEYRNRDYATGVWKIKLKN